MHGDAMSPRQPSTAESGLGKLRAPQTMLRLVALALLVGTGSGLGLTDPRRPCPKLELKPTTAKLETADVCLG